MKARYLLLGRCLIALGLIALGLIPLRLIPLRLIPLRLVPLGLIPLALIAPGLIAPVLIAPAEAASLRPATTLHGPRVYLRDLFDDAGVNAERLLGPGPGPGGRIVVEARQLRAIANQFDVDWRPASSGDRAVLEWPGHPLKREDAVAALRVALMAHGAAGDCDIDIPGYAPPIIPLSGTAPPIVSELDYDQDQGRFAATLTVTGDGMDPIVTRVTGAVADVVELPVPVMRLPANSIPGPNDVRMARVHVAAVHATVARTPEAIIGMQVRRQLQAGQPIALVDLMLPTQISRGDAVQLELEVGALWLSGQGIALESGAVGEKIRVRNISSQAILEAAVVRPGVVRVVPGTSPITAQARLGYPTNGG
jgi:flagellar basal body P-ring formation protein FlgA